MIERAWIIEADKNAPDWPRVLQNLAVFRDRTNAWRLPQLSSYAARLAHTATL